MINSYQFVEQKIIRNKIFEKFEFKIKITEIQAFFFSCINNGVVSHMTFASFDCNSIFWFLLILEDWKFYFF